MAFTDQEKLREVKKVLTARIEEVGSFEALKTLIGNVAWVKLLSFLEAQLQAEVDKCDAISQAALARKAKILALIGENF